jgi:hypothetical protein
LITWPVRGYARDKSDQVAIRKQLFGASGTIPPTAETGLIGFHRWRAKLCAKLR